MPLSHGIRRFAVHATAWLTLLTALIALVPDAHAQRAFSRRFPAPAAQPVNVAGDIALIGNINLHCDPAATNCASARTGGIYRNNDFSSLVYVNVDPDGGNNYNSSAATLALPAGANVLFAGLYWGGRADTTGVDPTTVRLRAPGGGYVALTADVTDSIATGNYQSYKDITSLVASAGNGVYTVANIAARAGTSDRWGGWTLVVAYQHAGSAMRNLSVFDGFQQGNGTNTQIDIPISGIYTPPSGPVDSKIGLVLYDGDRGVADDGGSGNPSLQFGPNSSALSAVSDAVNPVSDFWNSSVSQGGADVTAGRNPAYTNTLGLDIDLVTPNVPLPNGSTTAHVRTRASGGDVHYPGVITIATQVFSPEIITNFTKSAADPNGGQFRPGDTVIYQLSVSNTGNDNSVNTVITDPLPAGVTFVPGSLEIAAGPDAGAKTDAPGDDVADYDPGTRTVTFRIGTGATSSAGGTLAPVSAGGPTVTVRFQVTIDGTQANGASLSNIGQIDYTSQTSGQPGTGTTPPTQITVSRDADLSITKTGPANVNAGAPIQYVVTVSSLGPDNADNATVTDNVPAGITGITIACAASGGAVCPSTTGLTTLSALAIPTLPSGGSVVFTIDGTAPNTGATLNNTATVAPPTGTNDPTPANNTAGPVTTVVIANLDLAVTGTLTNVGPVYTGDTVTYSFTVTNNGPGNATGAPISIPVPPQLSGVSWTCAPAANCSTASGSGNVSVNGNLANGDALTITITGIAPTTTPSTIAAATGSVSAPTGQTDTNTANNSATVPAVTVNARPISAGNDSGGPVNGGTGGTAVANVLGNDTLGGAAATTANVGLTQLSSSNPGVTLNTTTGAVDIAAGTPAGSHTLTYRICETSNPSNCATATVSVSVSAQAITALNDASPQINGASGGVAIADVLANDSLGGSAPTTANVTLSVVTPASHPGVVLNTATGAVSVAAGTPAGSYPITYRICEQLNPTNCATATATANVGAAAIAAGNDAGIIGGASGGTAIASVLGNDTLNGGPATSANVTLVQVSTTSPQVTLDLATGAVNVAAGTPAGSYTVVYQICEQLNPTNCTSANAVATVTAAALTATPDAGTVTGNAGGPAVANVLGNDSFNGGTPTLAEVTLTQVATSNPQVTLDPATGTVNVAAGTPAGTYTLTYRFCERLNPANCATSTVTVTVTAAPIDAVDDTTPPVNGVVGNPVAVNVLGNDTLGGGTATTATVTLTQISSSSPTVALDPATGNVSVAAGTPAGTYVLSYRICEQLNPANCDTATVSVHVIAPALVATDDTGSTPQNTAVRVPVLGNDTHGGAPATATGVTITIVSAPANGTVTVNADGTVTYLPSTHYAGGDVFVYRICDVINPTVCDDAAVTLSVTPNSVDAVDATVTTAQAGAVVINPMTTTLNGGGAPLDPTSIAIVTPPTNGTVVVNPNGTITYTPNTTFFGTETFRYRICDRSTPTPVCDIATVTVVVAMQAPQLRVVKSAPARAVKPGELVRYTVTVENTGISPAQNATLVDVPPAGFSYVVGSLAVDDTDDAFVLGSTEPLRIAGIDVPVGGRATVVYFLRVGAGVGRGTHTNRVSATDATGITVSNTASADVRVEGEPLLEESLILGTVFDDRNGDGRQQADEPGLPGVRLAAVEGLLIETDARGRYHLVGIEAGNALRGRNFILKVDARSLPAGSAFTTPNPLVRRITPGIPVRFDFGVRLPSADATDGSESR